MCSEPHKGKGNVVRRAFADIDADIYLLIDGDDTYDAVAAPAMLEKLVDENLDQVVGVRRGIGATGPATRSATRRSTGSSAASSATRWATCSAATGSSPGAS